MDSDREFYQRRLAENWYRRFGQKRDGISRLTAYASAFVLVTAGAVLALATRAPHLVSPPAIVAAIGSVLAGIVLCHGLNKHFLALERAAFAELIDEPANAGPRLLSLRRSPFYPLAKLAMRPSVRFRDAWIAARMDAFLARRNERDRQADLFERNRIKLGSIGAA